MRTMIKLSMKAAPGNEALKNGAMQRAVQEFCEKFKPEATYFYAEEGKRTALMVFDLADPSDIPSVSEPFFMGMEAKIDLFPVMNLEDLQKGVKKAMEQMAAPV